MTPHVRIIITAYNSGDFLSACLAALVAQSFTDFEVIIVDNGGTPAGTHDVTLPDARFFHLISPENDGFSGGFVRGAQNAKTPWLMSLNPDTILDPDCLETLFNAAARHDNPAMLSPVLYADMAKTTLDGLGDSLSIWGIPWRNGHGHPARQTEKQTGLLSEVFSPTGAAALYRRDAYEAAGGFDPVFFCYLEDIDLAIRLRAYGGRCLLVHDAVGVHSGGHSTNAIDGFSLKYTARNATPMILGSVPAPLRWVMWPIYQIGQRRLQQRGQSSANPKDQDAASFREKGYGEAYALRTVARQRRQNRTPYPFGASLRLARELHWGLSGVRRHKIHRRPWKDRRSRHSRHEGEHG